MRAGDTYIRAGKHISTDPHLWVVISDPSKDRSKVVAVNLTSQRTDKEQTCVIQPGEHPFVTHETVVMYAGARVVSESMILSAKQAGMFDFPSPVSPTLLSRIRDGAEKSRRLPTAARRVLIDQGLISEPGTR
jgi:hypothetical protein